MNSEDIIKEKLKQPTHRVDYQSPPMGIFSYSTMANQLSMSADNLPDGS